MLKAIKLIEEEVSNYIEGHTPITEGNYFSQYKLVKRIGLYANQIYPTGKLDSQGNYKYWFDIITPRINAEIKNVDFDTKDIILYSENNKDSSSIFLANAALKEWMRETGQAEKLNEAVEESAGWGNVLLKKIKGGYEKCDLKNTYIINQTAKTIDETSVIERHEMTQSDLRAKSDVWNNIEDVILKCGNKSLSATLKSPSSGTQIPYYEIFERNGEISEEALFEAQDKVGKEGASLGKSDVFVLAKIVCAGLGKKSDKDDKFILYADKISKMPYKEYHRGKYEGRWWRMGLYEILFDIQTRANEIGNQIARGLEWASKTFFKTKNQLIVQNILSDLINGDIIESEDLSQITVRMEGFDQLIADWNRIIKLADDLANSYEVVTGETLPSGTPFRLGGLLNINANKLFDFLREKLALAIKEVFEDWILPDVISNLKIKDILRLTGNSDYLKRFYEMAVDAWYIKNLIVLGPHTSDEATTLKQAKLEEIKKYPEALVKLEKDTFAEVKPRVNVVITGEQVNLATDMETLSQFIQLESDPVRRTALIEMAMARKNIDIGMLPKSKPEELRPVSQLVGASERGGEKVI